MQQVPGPLSQNAIGRVPYQALVILWARMKATVLGPEPPHGEYCVSAFGSLLARSKSYPKLGPATVNVCSGSRKRIQMEVQQDCYGAPSNLDRCNKLGRS